MERKNYGMEFDRHTELVSTLHDFEDFLLFFLEDSLFKNKFNNKQTIIDIPILGKRIIETNSFSLDMRKLLDIPNFSIDGNGILFNSNGDKAYVSPDFYAKCFIEKTMDAFNLLMKLFPKHTNIGGESLLPDGELKHIDFIDTYNKLKILKNINEINTKGAIGLVPDYSENERILYFRKIEIGTEIQKAIKKVFEKILSDCISDFESNMELEEFNKEEYDKLEKEHNYLFSSGAFTDAWFLEEWELKNKFYDNGTDEQRKMWLLKFKEFRKKAEEWEFKIFVEKVKNSNYLVTRLQREIITYLKFKIINYDYNKKNHGNYFLTELGLDDIPYYAHPNDKYNPKRFNIIPDYSYDEYCTETAEESSEFYDEIYSGTNNSNYEYAEEDKFYR